MGLKILVFMVFQWELDSPYSSILGFLGRLMTPPIDQSIEEFYEHVREEVQRRAHFDIYDDVIDHVQNVHQPVIFIHGEND